MIRVVTLLALLVLHGCSVREGTRQIAAPESETASPFSFQLGNSVRSNESVFLSAMIENNELVLSCAPNRDRRLEPKELTLSCNLLGDEFVAPFKMAEWVQSEDAPIFGFGTEHFGIVMYDANHATPGRIRKLPINVKVEFK